MDVKKFSLAHGSIVDTSSFEVLKKSIRYISDSDRQTFVIVTDDNEIWAIYPKATRFVFSMNEGSEVSAMCFLPSSSSDENCVAFALFDRTSGDSSLRIVDLTTMSDCYNRVSAFPGRVTSMSPIDPSFKPDTWALAFGIESGAVGVFIFSESSCESFMVETLEKQSECRSPVTKLYWLKTRQILVCGYDSGFLMFVRLPSKAIIYGNSIENLPVSSIVSTEPENDPRLTCFVWVSCANGRRSSAAMVFRVEGESDNVICMGVHDLAANIPDVDTEKAWAYLVEISSSKQLGSSSNLISFLWEIGITGRSTDYYFAVFDINAWFSWQSQANLQLKEPVFGGSKFLAVFRLPRSVNQDNRLLGAFAISSSIVSFRPRVSIVPLTSPLLYPCSLAFDVLCICAESITKVRYKSLQEVLLKSCCGNSDFTRISEPQLTNFVEKLTTLGLIDMFDGSSIGCSHHESVLNAFFKFANEGEAARFAKKALQNENFFHIFRDWLFYRASAARKDLDMSFDLVFQKCDASEHLRAVESDIRLILRLTTCLPLANASFAGDLKRILSIFLDLIASFNILLKPDFCPVFNDALQAIPAVASQQCSNEMFRRRLKMTFAEVVSSRERFVNLLTSTQTANGRFDNIFILLYTFLNACPGDGVFTESLVEMLDADFQESLGVPPKFVRFVGAVCFLDRKLPAPIIRQCINLSRPLDFTVEDQVLLLKHLSQVDIDVAYEISLQLVMIYTTEKDTINWTGAAYFELFKLFLEIFSRKNYFDSSLQLCMMMPSEADRRCALVHFFKLTCSSNEPHFSSFLRLLSSSFSVSLTTGVDPLRECIKFMCTSKQRLLLERACVFFAERGPAFLSESLAIANRANDLRFVCLASSGNDGEVDRLVEKRRQIIEEKLGKMPDYARQRVVDKSKSEEMNWMFVASSVSSLPATNGETPKINDENLGVDYRFEWPEIEKLLVLPPNNSFANAAAPALSKTSISFAATNRRSSVMNFSALSNQPRLSTAKKCRFVDSPSPTSPPPPPPVEEPPAASSTLIISDEMEVQPPLMEQPAIKMPITPVVRTYLPQEPVRTAAVADPSPILPVPVKEDESCIMIESGSEEDEVAPAEPEPTEPAVAQALTPLTRKQFIPTSLKEPSPAQKAARRIVQRSVRFSCSPNKVVTIPVEKAASPSRTVQSTIISSKPEILPMSSYESGAGDVVEILSSSEEEENEEQPMPPQQEQQQDEDFEESNEEGDNWRREEEEGEEEGLYMEEESEEEETQPETISNSQSEENSGGSGKMEEDPEIYMSPMAESHHGRQSSTSERPPSIPVVVQPQQQEEEMPQVPVKPPTPPIEEIKEAALAVQSITSVVVEEEEDVVTHPPVQSPTAIRFIKSVINISPNRLAAQMALRRSMRIMTAKRRQELQDDKKAASSSLGENKEPVVTEKQQQESPSKEFLLVPVVVVEKVVTAPSPVRVSASSELELPQVEVDDCRAVTPPLAPPQEPMAVDDISEATSSKTAELEPPTRLTRSRSANSAIPPPQPPPLQSLDTSITTRRRARQQIELGRLSPQSSVASEPPAQPTTSPGIRTRGSTRSRTVSGSSESGVALPSVGEEKTEVVVSTRSGGRKRTQSASDIPEEAQIKVSPRRHLRKTASGTSTATTVVPVITVTEAPSEKSDEVVVTALPPRPTRKRAKSNEDGMVTPSTSPKRPNVSASVSKIEPPSRIKEGDDVEERRYQSAPSSPSRRTRRGVAPTQQEQAQQLTAALSNITDSPAYHTRRHNVTVQEGEEDTSPQALSTSSTTSTTTTARRATRSATKSTAR